MTGCVCSDDSGWAPRPTRHGGAFCAVGRLLDAALAVLTPAPAPPQPGLVYDDGVTYEGIVTMDRTAYWGRPRREA